MLSRNYTLRQYRSSSVFDYVIENMVVNDPGKNGGSLGRRYACPERLAGKRVQKS